MLTWFPLVYIIFSFFLIELVIYICYLVIKALRIYIKKNSENTSSESILGKFRKPWVKAIIIVTFNVIVVVLLLVMPTIIKNHDVYVTENVINIQEEDMDKAVELFEENTIEYKLVGKTGIKLMNRQDFMKAERIVKDNHIGYSVRYIVN